MKKATINPLERSTSGQPVKAVLEALPLDYDWYEIDEWAHEAPNIKAGRSAYINRAFGDLFQARHKNGVVYIRRLAP